MTHVRAAFLVAIGALAASSLSCRSDEPMGAPNDLVTAAQPGRGQPCRGAAVCRLVFTVPPSTTPSGSTIAPAVEVTVQDALGNTVTGYSGNVKIAIGTNPSAGHLSGTKTVSAVSGVARFADLSIDQPGRGYTLDATSGSIPAVTSAAFAISGPATQLLFTVQPSDAAAGAAIAPAVQVTALDANGVRDASFSGSVTVAITPGTGTAGAVLFGTRTAIPTIGVANFQNLAINLSGAGYTLTASAAGLIAATSTPFNIHSGAATQLLFTVQPSTTVAGQTIAPAVAVAAVDPLGNIDLAFTGTVVIAIATNAGGGTLSGTTNRTAVAGLTIFDNLGIDKAGSGYTLVASAAAIPSATSAAFDILPGPATHVVFTGQPATTIAGEVIAPAVQVTAQDAFGNTDPSYFGDVTISIGVNPGVGVLSGTTIQAPFEGVVGFDDLSIDKAGTGYTLNASAAGLAGASSVAFDILPGAATQLVFTVQPTNTVAGAAIAPAVRVEAQDALGNTDVNFAEPVRIGIGTNPAGGTLSGSTELKATQGVATFSNLSINKAGSGYTLVASTGIPTEHPTVGGRPFAAGAAEIPSATSAAFSITAGTAVNLIFIVQPSNAAAGAQMALVQVAAVDALGNIAVTFNGNITLAIFTNPSGGVLSGTLTVAAVAGIATFTNLHISLAGTGYQLVPSSPGLTGEISAVFEIQ